MSIVKRFVNMFLLSHLRPRTHTCVCVHCFVLRVCVLLVYVHFFFFCMNACVFAMYVCKQACFNECFVKFSGNASDPCHDYSELPRKDYRYHEFKVNDKTYDHDYYLEEGWYRAGDLTIPDTPPPDFNRCGTSVPIWMQGTK